jgi:hypothetical protein
MNNTVATRDYQFTPRTVTVLLASVLAKLLILLARFIWYQHLSPFWKWSDRHKLVAVAANAEGCIERPEFNDNQSCLVPLVGISDCSP